MRLATARFAGHTPSVRGLVLTSSAALALVAVSAPAKGRVVAAPEPQPDPNRSELWRNAVEPHADEIEEPGCAARSPRSRAQSRRSGRPARPRLKSRTAQPLRHAALSWPRTGAGRRQMPPCPHLPPTPHRTLVRRRGMRAKTASPFGPAVVAAVCSYRPRRIVSSLCRCRAVRYIPGPRLIARHSAVYVVRPNPCCGWRRAAGPETDLSRP